MWLFSLTRYQIETNHQNVNSKFKTFGYKVNETPQNLIFKTQKQL